MFNSGSRSLPQTGLLVQDVSTSPSILTIHADCLVKSKQYLRSLVYATDQKFYERALKYLNPQRQEWVDQIQTRYVDACIQAKEFYKARERVYTIYLSWRAFRILIVPFGH
jgi:hypothetical protein